VDFSGRADVLLQIVSCGPFSSDLDFETVICLEKKYYPVHVT
jgi:hypothetical protein